MAHGSKSTGGLIIGAFLVLLLAAGLAATPFYLKTLLPPDRAADNAVLPEVEEVRRIALELDQHLALMQDIYKSGIPDAVPAQSELDEHTRPVEGSGTRQIHTPLTGHDISALEQTSKLLRDAMVRDKDRGLSIFEIGKNIQSGAPDANRANDTLRKIYFTQQDKLLKEADSALLKLRSAQSGGRGAASSLWASRVAATLELAKGEMHRQQAEFESSEMAQGYHSAALHAEGLRSVRRLQEILAGQKPEDAIAAVDQQAGAAEADAAKVTEALDKLSAEIKSRRTRASSLEKTADEARKRMAELEKESNTGAPYPAEYASLSESARHGEAEAAAIMNGTLAGAKLVEGATEARESPAYEGGEPQVGVRDLEFRLDSFKKQAELLAADRERLAKEKESLTKWQQELDERKTALEKKAGELAQRVQTDIAAAEKYAAASLTAYEAAVKSFASAAKLAKESVTGAKNRTAEARQAGSGPKPDDRLTRVAADGDPEASMHCLAADVAYRLALCHTARIDAIQDQLAGATRLSSLTGGEQPKANADEVDRLRTDAQNLLADALKSYEQASNLISKTNVKFTFTDAAVSGKNYVWAVNVGQAAVHLLQAQLQTSDKAEDAFAQKALAFNLLKEAAKGREQSGLLSPAIDTAIYLQQSTKKSEPSHAVKETESEEKSSAESNSESTEKTDKAGKAEKAGKKKKPASKPADEEGD